MSRLTHGFWTLLLIPALLMGTFGCETMRQHKIATGAVLGTAAGALAGGIIGHQSGHRGAGALIGAAAGAALGTGIGYALDRQARKYEQVQDVQVETVQSAPAQVATNEQASTPPPPQEPPHLRLRLNNEVLFDKGSSALKPAGTERLRQIADIMKQDPTSRVVVRGFASAEGDDAYNLQLSKARAEMVANQLVFDGVNPQRIQAMGMGESNPIADNATESGRIQNRRVEIDIFPAEEATQ
ncbi:MAG: OmpA family protein [bacterium]|nr:OmpA family protein [bacterium]